MRACALLAITLGVMACAAPCPKEHMGRRIICRIADIPYVAPTPDPDPVDLIVIMGESNAVGRGLNSSASVGELAAHSRVYITRADTLITEPLDVGTNNYITDSDATHHGPELGLANEVEADGLGADSTVYVVKSAGDGTMIYMWMDGGYPTLDLWNNRLINRIDAAVANLVDQDIDYRITVWQSIGINDYLYNGDYTQDSPGGDAWASDMGDFRAAFRARYGAGIPFILTHFDDAIFGWNAKITAMEVADPDFYSISDSGCTTSDGLHWDYASLKILAARWVAKMNEIYG